MACERSRAPCCLAGLVGGRSNLLAHCIYALAGGELRGMSLAQLSCIALLMLLPVQDPAPGRDTAPDWLLATAGSWSGHLEYADYGSGKTVRIPAKMEASAAVDRSYMSWGLTLTDPGREIWSMNIATIERGPVLVMREFAKGRCETARHSLSQVDVKGPASWTVVSLADGKDNGKAAQIRRTWRLADGVLTSTTDVRLGDGDWFQRNQLKLSRATADPAASLVGEWKVDLRPTPDAAEYFQTMVIDSIKDGALTGKFYGSQMSDGRINAGWGAVRFAFTTSDGSGQYHTHAVLRGNRIEGTTHSVGRGFLSYWTAVRQPK